MIADPRENARALFQLFPRDDEVTTEKSWFILQQQFEFDFPEFRRVFDTEQWHHFAPFNNSKAFQFAKINRSNFLTVDTNAKINRSNFLTVDTNALISTVERFIHFYYSDMFQDSSQGTTSLIGELRKDFASENQAARSLNGSRKTLVDLITSRKQSVASNCSGRSTSRAASANGMGISPDNGNNKSIASCKDQIESTSHAGSGSLSANLRKPLNISELLSNFNSELLKDEPPSASSMWPKSYNSFRKSYKSRTEVIHQSNQTLNSCVEEPDPSLSSYEKWKSTTAHRSFGNGFEKRILRVESDSEGSEEVSTDSETEQTLSSDFVAKIEFSESETESDASCCSTVGQFAITEQRVEYKPFVAVISARSDTDDSSSSEEIVPSQMGSSLNNRKSHGLFINSNKRPLFNSHVSVAKKPFPSFGERKARRISEAKVKALDMMRKKGRRWRPPENLVLEAEQPNKCKDATNQKSQNPETGEKKMEVRKTTSRRNSGGPKLSSTTPSPGTQKKIRLKLYKPITIKPRTIDSNSPERIKPRRNSKAKSVSSRESTPSTTRKDYLSPKSRGRPSNTSVQEQKLSIGEVYTRNSPSESRKKNSLRDATNELDNKKACLATPNKVNETYPPRTPKSRRVRTAVDVDTTESVVSAMQCALLIDK